MHEDGPLLLKPPNTLLQVTYMRTHVHEASDMSGPWTFRRLKNAAVEFCVLKVLKSFLKIRLDTVVSGLQRGKIV